MFKSSLINFSLLFITSVLLCGALLSDASVLDKAWDVYSGSCTCGKSYGSAGGNCAHYVGNALIKAGLRDIDGGKGAEFRTVHGMVVCKSGRPVRAKELRDWFKKHGKQHSSLPSGKVTLVYQRRPSDGQDHVVMRKGIAYRGTGNYPSWSVQEYYTLD